MSGRSEREKRKEARVQAETASEAGERRKKMMQLASGGVFLAIVAVVALIVVNGSSSGGDSSNIEGASEVSQALSGIPQNGMVLGNPSAPVEVAEFADLQCPFCKAFTEETLPAIIENQVKNGEAKIDFRNFTIIGEQSLPAGAAALAAGEQGRGWNFVEIFYRNQGAENTGYADDAFLEAVAKAAGVKDMAKWNEDRAKLTSKVEATTAEAQELGLGSTPSIALKGPGTQGLEPIETPQSSEGLEAAIEDAS